METIIFQTIIRFFEDKFKKNPVFGTCIEMKKKNASI